MTRPDWIVVFIIPSLKIKAQAVNDVGLTLGLTGMALVARDDPRVQAYCEWSPAASTLLSRFLTEYSRPHDPTRLVAHRRWLDSFGKRAEPVIAFRNAVAMACVCHVRANGGWQGASWTESFDHHAAEVAVDGSHVDILTPALQSFAAPVEDMVFTLEHGLPVAEYIFSDERLAVWLGKAWLDTYRNGRNVAAGRTLFRSLELAYMAASMRSRNYSSIHEVGVGTVLWVNAIEILAAPSDRNVRRLDGHALVEQFVWDMNPLLDSRRYRVVEHRRPKIKYRGAKLVAKVYDHLYEARSKFVHGDQVSRALLRPFGPDPAPPLLALASTVYRTALLAYLQRHWKWTRQMEAKDHLGTFWLSAYEQHLLKAVDQEVD